MGTVEKLDYTEEASLSGPTTEPTLAFTPTVSPEGRVVFVLGESFLPGLPVELTWDTCRW